MEEVEGYDTAFTGISEHYRNALLNYKEIIPILILPPKKILYGKTTSFEEMKDKYSLNSTLDSLLDLCDGFLVPGGSKWFSYDEYIVEYALRKNKPILGVCLGMQIMGIVDNKLNSGIFDGTFKLDKPSHYQPKAPYAHSIRIKEGSQLSSILGVNTCKVNSRHHYCIQDVVDFVISAYSDDGVVEAIEHPKKVFAIGVQWHPELMFEYDIVMKKLIDAFVSSVLTAKQNRL